MVKKTGSKNATKRRSSVLHVLIEHPWALIRGAFGGWAFQSGFYTIAIFISSYLVTGNIFSESTALGLQSASLGAALFIAPVAGFLSDRFGHKSIALVSLVGILLGAYPLFHVVNKGNNAPALAAMVTCMLCVTLMEIAHNRMAPVLFLVVASMVSFLMCMATRETGNRPLK